SFSFVFWRFCPGLCRFGLLKFWYLPPTVEFVGRVWQGFRGLCGSLESISKSIAMEEMFDSESMRFQFFRLLMLDVLVSGFCFDCGDLGDSLALVVLFS
ncbi:hypothetical protein Ancab_035852, partial [Ancistrocladus abbreviatus]